MEAITQINEGNWGPNAPSFFGRAIPEGVAQIGILRTHHTFYDLELRWTTKNAEEHTMPFKTTDEGISVALVAMKLSC